MHLEQGGGSRPYPCVAMRGVYARVKHARTCAALGGTGSGPLNGTGSGALNGTASSFASGPVLHASPMGPPGYRRSLSNVSIGSAHGAPIAPAATYDHPAYSGTVSGGQGVAERGSEPHVHFTSPSGSQTVSAGADGAVSGMLWQPQLVAGGSPQSAATPENVFSGEEDASGEPGT